jgi:2-oxoglutarate dehydrogenase E1 component
MKDFQYITSSHPQYIEQLYHDFVQDPASVDLEMKKFFEGFDFAVQSGYQPNGQSVSTQPAVSGTVDWKKEIGAYRLILGYRNRGHLLSTTNPIRKRKDRGARLDLENFGLADADLDHTVFAAELVGLKNGTLRQLVAHLQKSYTTNVGIEFKYIIDKKKVEFLIQAMEKDFHQPFPIEKRKRILEKLNQGVLFEKFLHTKYIGQKRFSLEGGETAIAALDAIINLSADYGVKEVAIGMAHRGRLNILANIMGKTYEHIFSEFEGTASLDQTMGSGDVKYHMGYGSELVTTGNKKIYLKLLPNPSHLEAVNPVVVGFSRAKADLLTESNFDEILPILIHGDASIAGQGIVYEVLQMSGLHGYETGGTLHFVINNQIGFTTDFEDARSADYCTSLAAMVQAPVLHVNGDDAEAVVKCVEIATRYRQEFNSDVFIDMVCYRKHGHNEGDDPKFTQPQLYALIEKHLNPREVYTQYLLQSGEADAKEMAKTMEQKFWADLQERLDEVKQNPLPYTYQSPEVAWRSLRRATEEDFMSSPDTAISPDVFNKIFNSLMSWPDDFKPLKKVEKILQEKIKLFQQENKVDWATGELMAYGSLLLDGKDVRMSGQDVQRGTFSHRHAVLRDELTARPYSRLSAIDGATGKFRVYNSLLSEYGVLGFEYGYAMAHPDCLVIWEAQFGDFCNGAQTIFDQFIAAGEQKWNRMNGLTILLPHGYEGQGPEHSSARMERFLQLCAELNMAVTNITTSANFFHALRRQLTWSFRKPLINFSPKANLRHPGSYSLKDEFLSGGFKEVLDDPAQPVAADVKKVFFCSGKIFFDLAERRDKEQRTDIAIIRLEQLYPLPEHQVNLIRLKYNKAAWFWVQEEPMNMGAAAYLKMNLNAINFGVIARQASASTATGYNKVHQMEQAELIDTAFSIK